MVGPNQPNQPDRPEPSKGQTSQSGDGGQTQAHQHKPRFEADDLGRQAAEASQDARQRVREMGEQVKQRAQAAAGRAKRQAAEAADQLRSQGEAALDQQKNWAADELMHCAHASRAAAEKLREEQDANVARWADIIADRMEGVAGYIRDRNAGQMIGDVGSVARRHPELFFGGMFVLGLVAARFLKASRENAYRGQAAGYEEYGAEYGSEYGSAYGGAYGEEFDRSMPVPSGSMPSGPFPPVGEATPIAALKPDSTSPSDTSATLSTPGAAIPGSTPESRGPGATPTGGL